MSENEEVKGKAAVSEKPPESVEASGAAEEMAEAVVDKDQDVSGRKPMAVNQDGILKQEAEKGEPAQSAPSFFVDKTKRHRVEVDVLWGRNGEVLSVIKSGPELDWKQFQAVKHTTVWFEFTRPAYDDMSAYRQRCAIYRRGSDDPVVNRYELRNFFLVYHLKDWNVTLPDGSKAELKFDDDGTLSRETLEKMVYPFNSTILDVVLTLFEREILLI